MTVRFGDNNPTTFRWGDSAVSKLYFGDNLVWPDGIIPVSNAYAASTTVTMPTHQAGDTIIVFVSRVGSATPALQSGWTNIANHNRAVGTGNWSGRVAYKIASSDSEVVGTWSAEQILVLVYRNVSAIGVSEHQGGTGGTLTYPAATLQGANGKSWAVRFSRGGGSAATSSDLLTGAPISGYAVRAGNDLVLAQDTNAAISTNPAAQTQVTTATNYWWAVTVELRAT